MSDVTLSFICATNDKKTLNEMLMASLKKQKNQDFELIVIDAKEHGFKSASETLNYGASIAKGGYLCFVHQDIEFLNNDAVDKIIDYFNSNDFGIAGVAGETGKTKKEYTVYSSVIMDKERKQAGILLNTQREAYSVDECVMFVKKYQFKQFDNYGDSWHFYGVEYSLRCVKNNEKVLLFPINIYHKSSGVLNNSYWDTLNLVAKKHKDVKVIKTCCGNFNNNCIISLYCFAHKVKNVLKEIGGNRKCLNS